MKIKIDACGHLNVERGGKWKQQTCPHKNLPCGDWCPKFREPQSMCLLICDNNLLYGEITDERPACVAVGGDHA